MSTPVGISTATGSTDQKPISTFVPSGYQSSPSLIMSFNDTRTQRTYQFLVEVTQHLSIMTQTEVLPHLCARMLEQAFASKWAACSPIHNGSSGPCSSCTEWLVFSCLDSDICTFRSCDSRNQLENRKDLSTLFQRFRKGPLFEHVY